MFDSTGTWHWGDVDQARDDHTSSLSAQKSEHSEPTSLPDIGYSLQEVDMIWASHYGVLGNPILGVERTYGLYDPRIRATLLSLRLHRWTPAVTRKWQFWHWGGRRYSAAYPYYEGDLRTQRLQHCLAPTPTREHCLVEEGRNFRYLNNSRDFDFSPEVDFPEPAVRFPSLQDQSNHEFIPMIDLMQANDPRGPPDPPFGHPAEEPRRLQWCGCGSYCIHCRLYDYSRTFSDLFRPEPTIFALKAWIEEFVTKDMEDVLFEIRTPGWADCLETEPAWRPIRNCSFDEIWRCRDTSAYFLGLLDKLPRRARNLFALAGGVRIPTWEWSHKQGGALDDGNWHCLGYELMHATTSARSRVTTQVCLLQDISNQDYATVFNQHLTGRVPWPSRNCFEKANAIDMFIGLGRISSRLTQDQKIQLYELTGDLENFSRFWERILNLETHENSQLRDKHIFREPSDPEDDPSGVPNSSVGRLFRISNTYRWQQGEDYRGVWTPLLSGNFAYKDSWPNHINSTGFFGDAENRPL